MTKVCQQKIEWYGGHPEKEDEYMVIDTGLDIYCLFYRDGKWFEDPLCRKQTKNAVIAFSPLSVPWEILNTEMKVREA